MKKVLFGALVALALCAAPSLSLAGPPGFYSGGTWVSPYPNTPFATGPTQTGFSYYSSPWGYQTLSTYSATPTPWGWNTTFSNTTAIKPIAGGPWHSVYWDPINNTYQYLYGVGTTNNNRPTWYRR
jgi:hypothetical protein